MRRPYSLVVPFIGLVAIVARADEPAKFRTDADLNSKTPWFMPIDGEFPPENSAHAFSGELIQVSPAQRRFVLRADRTDRQNRGKFDLPVASAMLPYGAIYYHGAPASLADIPLGTHLHGRFYPKAAEDDEQPIDYNGRISDEVDFKRCLLLEDDFSHYARLNQVWRVDEVNLAERKLSATLEQDGNPVGDRKTFDLLPSTRVWKGRGFESAEYLERGQRVQLNITWATLYGPGRVLDVWLDEAARNFATAHQLEKHRLYIRQRGLAGWIDAVDDQKRIITVTFFGGTDPALFKELVKGEEVGVCVATPTLMTYDPVNDRRRGPVLLTAKAPAAVGSSGVQVQIQPELMLEGFRPKRIVRVFPGNWPVIALPIEENLGLMQ